jgi:hypothetical protein
MTRSRRRDARLPLSAISAMAVGLAAAPAGLSAQQLDTGRLAIEIDGRRVGTESFRVWREQTTIDAFALVTRENGGSQRSLDVRFRSDANLRPVQYRLRAEPEAMSVDGEWTGGRLRLHVNSDQGERWKEFATPGGAAVLEEGVAHHYLLLAHRLREAEIGRSLAVIVPSRSSRVEGILRARQSDPVTVEGQNIAATRFDIEVGGQIRRVWIDAEGRLLRVEDPGRRLVATRLPDED